MATKKAEENDESIEDIYKKIVYQIVGELLAGKDLKVVLECIKKEEIGFDSSTFRNIKEKQFEIDNFIVNPFTVEEGIAECRKCNGKRVYTYSKQKRSADEPATVYAQCVNPMCKNRWVNNG